MDFSVCMAVYRKDKIKDFRLAVESIYNGQTVKPSEIVIVVDGLVPDDISRYLTELETTPSSVFKIIRLPENKGLGNALRVGVECASYSIIARMDSDDISLGNRFEKQIAYIEANPKCDIIGGQITEFINNDRNIIGQRLVPGTHKEISDRLKYRCPFNHMTVMFKKGAVVNAGNYQSWHFNEDYYLWIRMALAGCHFANLPDTLVNVRVGKDMYARRGGWKYFKSEKGLQDYMYNKNLISLPIYIFNVSVRFVVQVAMPNKLRGFIFQKLFRK